MKNMLKEKTTDFAGEFAGYRLKMFRESLGYSLDELAREIDDPAVKDVEKGLCNKEHMTTLFRLRLRFGLNLNWLLFGGEWMLVNDRKFDADKVIERISIKKIEHLIDIGFIKRMHTMENFLKEESRLKRS